MARSEAIAERIARHIARRTSRRSLLAVLGCALTGSAGLPLLPIARAAGQHGGAPARAPAERTEDGSQDPGDRTSCDYWRYCAVDGFLCACCGGSPSTCPPGTEMSPVTWIGTCRNPSDKRLYVISYNDCCGKSSCGRCLCNRNIGDRPVLLPQKNNDINWCLGTASTVYNCTTAVLVGTADG